MFGAKEDPSDVDILTEEGITIEYWNLAVKKDNAYLLVPLFAGNEDNGYYIVRTNCDMSDFNMSDTLSLSEQNITFTANSSIIKNEPEPDTDTPNTNTSVSPISSDEFSFEITEIEIEDYFVITDYTLSSGDTLLISFTIID